MITIPAYFEPYILDQTTAHLPLVWIEKKSGTKEILGGEKS
jgi:hypothetical protein